MTNSTKNALATSFRLTATSANLLGARNPDKIAADKAIKLYEETGNKAPLLALLSAQSMEGLRRDDQFKYESPIKIQGMAHDRIIGASTGGGRSPLGDAYRDALAVLSVAIGEEDKIAGGQPQLDTHMQREALEAVQNSFSPDEIESALRRESTAIADIRAATILDGAEDIVVCIKNRSCYNVS